MYGRELFRWLATGLNGSTGALYYNLALAGIMRLPAPIEQGSQVRACSHDGMQTDEDAS
ncbi:MAG TPA: hypothetical protein VKV19_19770 [Ktedonobacteraceae bacterium]|nr:hypothetical protein [Ktedonobacteraceae bacterium]